ncbi:hypothetical protein K469DRAFT_589541 [Zopfia rhizophila CBS 207.26]|uniref:Uncharacterized protein n=1 Tax=Zopfia rhizophila CBS 207.26 TaxID=1314779 RepID=A0A6A6DT15_9PEZI|nr:hypothetical protein K469DRAFT_589541 [Zopfia rhizophila CBS 207.26]
MPPTRHTNNGPQAATSARKAPYPQIAPKQPQTANNDEDKENHPPQRVSPNQSQKRSSKEPDRSNLPNNYLDIQLEEKKGEVPVYENATAVRRKLNKLLDSKSTIPGSSKRWNKTSLSGELQKLAQKNHPVKTHNGVGNNGPSVRALDRFLKKSGGMGGGDSEAYYWGNMLLEKLRIWNGEKKTKARENAEKE